MDRMSTVTISRPAFAVTCASYRLIDWLRLFSGNLVAWVRPHLQAVAFLDHSDVSRVLSSEFDWTLMVNARLVPSCKNFGELKKLAEFEGAAKVVDNGQLLAAKVSTSALAPLADPELPDESPEFIGFVADLNESDIQLDVLNQLHEIIKFNSSEFTPNLEHRIQKGDYKEIRDGVFARDSIEQEKHIVTHTTDGPIVLDSSNIGPFTFIEGPVYIGRGSRIAAHSAIKECVSVGHTCKLGGEIEATVIEPFTNKQHHGFLGHGYLGSWINIGAGTCNSDLKNTYGNVKMQIEDETISTDMQFVGCFVGDFVKTAINTSVFTGKTIGPCSLVYGFATTNVPAFVNYGRSFGNSTEVDPEVMIETQRRMFRRRNVEPRPCDAQLIRDMFALTADQRTGLECRPLVF